MGKPDNWQPYVYMQEKDDGSYYIGKCDAGQPGYQGSGKIFTPSYKKNPGRWTKIVIASNLDTNQTRWLERALVGPDVVEDPMSYNLAVGGMGGTITEAEKELRSEKYSGSGNPNYGNGHKQAGSNNGRSRLTESQVKQIDQLLKDGLSHSKIANLFNMSKCAITEINTGKRWSQVTGRKRK